MSGMIRILRRFVMMTMFISIMLLIFNFVLLGTFVFKEINLDPSPEDVIQKVIQGMEKQSGSYSLNEEAENLLKQHKAWAMLIAKDGRVAWGYEVPKEVPRTYDLVEAAKFSRYYLKDYPVYIWEHADGLFVLGYPKNSHAKYQFHFLSDWVLELPVRIMLLLLLNIGIALLFSIVIGMRLFQGIRPLIEGVHNLAKEKKVELKANGLFRDLAQSINTVSDMLQKKTAALKARDEARSNWIAGISHDIRTPLSIILGYASEMEENQNLPAEERHQARIIRRQGEKLRSLVSDLNLVSMLEYEMQPMQLKPIRLAVLARQAAADFINNGLDEKYDIELNLIDESVQIMGDEKLLNRAITNLVHNSVRHNPQGCKIILETSLAEDPSLCLFAVIDNGKGIPEEQLADITELPYSSKRKEPNLQGHGLGLPMAARIAKAHQGRLILVSGKEHKGLKAVMEFQVFRSGSSPSTR